MLEPSSGRRYQVFLSHNSADKAAVEEVANCLNAAGITTFLDKWHLVPGDLWQPALEEALGQSASCAVFVGPSGLAPWQNEEMRAAINARVKDPTNRYRVVPVLLPNASREQKSNLPMFLQAATWVEFSRGTLQDNDAVHRLVCGIMGRMPERSPGEALYEGECPYRGLQVFDVNDARFFFGRDSQVDWMLDKLARSFGTIQENRFLGVIGASGSGKSSLVRAGLIPALQSGQSRNHKGIAGSADWPVAILKPGTEPLKALADALWANPLAKLAVGDPLTLADQLRADGRRLHATVGTALTESPEQRRFVIVVDQFEELFTQFETRLVDCNDEQERAAIESERIKFVDNLVYAATIRGGRTLVVISLRADFYAKCSNYQRLAAALADAQELVPPLDEEDLRTAIEKPAALCGLELEPGLVDLLLHDMAQQPAGALPLLQQTLYMLYQRRNGRRLTVQAYRDIGKIEGALEAHANLIYQKSLRTDEQRDICRRVLLKLTTPGEGTEDTRRRVSRSQLGENAATDAVLQELVNGRLITVSKSDPPQVEVTHEALIRGWKELRNWLDADRESLRTLHQLLDAAEDWQRHGRDPAFLYTGSRLIQAEEWGKNQSLEIADLPLAREFLRQAVENRDAELRRREVEKLDRLQALEKLAETERQRANAAQNAKTTFFRLGVVAIVMLMVALASTYFTWQTNRELDRETKLSRENERRTRHLAAEALLHKGAVAVRYESDVIRGIHSLVEAMRVGGEEMPQLSRSARNIIESESRRLPKRSFVHDVGLLKVAFSPEGSRIVTACEDKTTRLWDARTGALVGEPMIHEGVVANVAFSPDGRQVLMDGGEKTARLWDTQTGTPLGEPLAHGEVVTAVAFCPDGTRVLTGSGDKTARLWDSRTGAPLGVPMTHGSVVTAVAFSPDGDRILTASMDKTARLWNGNTGSPLSEPMAHEGDVDAVAFSPDGRIALTASEDGTARLWDGRKGTLLAEPMKHQSGVVAAIFSPDGSRILTASEDSTARLWDGETGVPMAEPMQHQGSVLAAAFSPDGRRIVTASADNTARVWDGKTGAPLGEPMKHGHIVFGATFSPDGSCVLTGSYESIARLWEVKSYAPLNDPIEHKGAIQAAKFSPDSSRIVTCSNDKTARLWDVKAGTPLGKSMEHQGSIVAVAFSPDGNQVLTGSRDETSRLWDGKTGEPLSEAKEHADVVRAVAFSPDGGRFLTADWAGTVQLWDRNGVEPLGEPIVHEGRQLTVAFSPDGGRVLTANDDDVARLWDAKTSQMLGNPMEHEGRVVAVAFSPDGSKVVTGSWDCTARLWDGKTGAPLAEPMVHEEVLTAVAFSPDGTEVLTGSRDKTARLWDANTGTQIGEPINHSDDVSAVAFSADGSRILTGNYYVARMWDTKTKVPLGEPMTHGNYVEFSSDGSRILTLSEDVIIWPAIPRAPNAPDRVWISVEVRTGRTLRYGNSVRLTQAEWLDRRRRLDSLGGDCLSRTWDDLTESERLELRTFLVEDSNDSY